MACPFGVIARKIGDAYVKDEFRRHTEAEADFLPTFLAKWEEYGDNLEESSIEGADKNLGKGLSLSEKESLSAEQREQLSNLRASILPNDKEG